jgi:copper chaperone CopZ
MSSLIFKVAFMFVVMVATVQQLWAQPATQPARFELTDAKQLIEAPSKAILAVKGLSCPQCAGNIERQLDRIKAVQEFKLDLDDGIVTLTLRDKSSVSRDRLAKAVEDAGYTLDKVWAQPAGE